MDGLAGDGLTVFVCDVISSFLNGFMFIAEIFYLLSACQIAFSARCQMASDCKMMKTSSKECENLNKMGKLWKQICRITLHGGITARVEIGFGSWVKP